MKKIIALLTLIALVFTFAACSEGDVAKDGGEAKGDTVSVVNDLDRVKLVTEISVGDTRMTQTYSYLKAGEYKLYFAESDMGIEQYYVENGEGIVGYSRVAGQTEFYPIEGEGMADLTSPLAALGIESDKYFDGITGSKAGEEKVGDFDCTVYEVEYTVNGEEISSRVWVDKESGLWVKNTFTEQGEEITLSIKEISDKIGNMPGTIPVKVSEGQLYSESGLTLNLKGIDFNPAYAATLKMEAVNSTDSALKVNSKYFDVNGLCIGGNVFNISVPAGQSLDFDIKIPDSSCEAAGIAMIEGMEFAVSAEKYHTEQDGEGTYDVSDGMLIPRSEAIKIATVCPVTLPKEESGERRVLCSTPDFDVYFGGIKENAFGGYDFIVYYESEFSEDIRVTANIHEVNGKEYDDFEKIYVYGGRKGFGGFSFQKDKVTEKPTSVKLSFEAFTGELYNGTCVLEETEPFVLTL